MLASRSDAGSIAELGDIFADRTGRVLVQEQAFLREFGGGYRCVIPEAMLGLANDYVTLRDQPPTLQPFRQFGPIDHQREVDLAVQNALAQIGLAQIGLGS
jgi:hypothetical protein